MPVDATREIYERADIVVDQLLIGAYGQFALEGMALGRPVLCYLNPRFAAHHPEWAEVPIVSATPDTILDVLRELVRDPKRREELGSRGPDVVRRYHSLEAVGAHMAAIYSRLWTEALRTLFRQVAVYGSGRLALQLLSFATLPILDNCQVAVSLSIANHRKPAGGLSPVSAARLGEGPPTPAQSGRS